MDGTQVQSINQSIANKLSKPIRQCSLKTLSSSTTISQEYSVQKKSSLDVAQAFNASNYINHKPAF
jgi:hypothetical protein